MKKPPFNSLGDKNPLNALMSLISEEVERAEKQENTAVLRDWLELGYSVLKKFGAASDIPEFGRFLEKGLLAADTPDEGKPFPQVSFPGPASPPLAYEERFTPEAAASLLNSCILSCDIIIAGNDSAVGLKYDEENMFAPMIILLERGPCAEALIWAAESLGVPVVKNLVLAKNLASYGKTGESIPDATYREVSLAFARLGSGRMRMRSRTSRKSRQVTPVKLEHPLSVELGGALFALTGEDPGRDELLARPLDAMRSRLKYLLGFPVASFRISRNTALAAGEYRIFFKGIEAGRGRLELGWYDGEAVPDMMKIPENIRKAAKAASSFILRHASSIILLRAPELFGRDEVDSILESAEEKYPVVVGEVKSLLSLGIIREIFQTLVSEQVSIRHIAVILETLADWGSFGSVSSGMIIEQIRQSLKRQICLEYADENLSLRVLTLNSGMEGKFSEHSPAFITEPEKSTSVNSDPVSGEPWYEESVDLISAAVMSMEEKGFPPVILCSPRARPAVKEATRCKIPHLAVLSYLEIPSDIKVEPLGEIGLA